MSLGAPASGACRRFQGQLPPSLAEEAGPLNERRRRPVAVMDLAPVENFPHCGHRGAGRPPTTVRPPGPSSRRRCGIRRPRAP